MEEEVRLSERDFKALSAANRIAILKLLKEKNHNPTELAAKLDTSVPTIHKHLEILVESGLVERIEDDRKWVYYRLTRKGGGLVDPSRARFVLLLGITAAIVLGAIAVYWMQAPMAVSNGTLVLKQPVVTENGVLVEWRVDGETQDAVFSVERKKEGSDRFEVISSGLTATAFHDTNVEPFTAYAYRVVAHRQDQSITSNETTIAEAPSAVNAGTAPEQGAPGPSTESPAQDPLVPPPALPPLAEVREAKAQWVSTTNAAISLGAQAPSLEIGSTSPIVLVVWKADEKAGRVFEIERRENNGAWKPLGSNGGESFWVDSDVGTGMVLEYRVRALDGLATGPWSIVASVSAN